MRRCILLYRRSHSAQDPFRNPGQHRHKHQRRDRNEIAARMALWYDAEKRTFDGGINKVFVEMLDKLGYDIQLIYVKKKSGGDVL